MISFVGILNMGLLGEEYKIPSILVARRNVLVTLPFKHYNLSFHRDRLLDEVNEMPRCRHSTAAQFINVQCHCLFQYMYMTRLNKPTQSHSSLNTPGLSRRQLCCNGANLLLIGQEVRCSGMTLVPEQGLFDYRTLTVWERCVACRLFSLKLCKGVYHYQLIRFESNAKTHVFSTNNQGVLPGTHINLVTMVCCYINDKLTPFSKII